MEQLLENLPKSVQKYIQNEALEDPLFREHGEEVIKTAVSIEKNLSISVMKNVLKYIEAYADMEVIEIPTLTIYVKPSGGRRPRATSAGGPGVRMYAHPNDTKDKKAFMAQIKDALGKEFEEIRGEVEATFTFYFAYDSNFTIAECILAELGYILPMKKPDIDNSLKLYLDALSGYLYVDDTQVVLLNSKKFYSKEPRVEVSFELKPDCRAISLK